jgi:hypothetical protein
MITIDGKEVTTLQVFTYDKQQEITTLNARITQLNSEVALLQASNEAKEDEIALLQQRIASLQQQLEEYQNGGGNGENPPPPPPPDPEPPTNVEYLFNKSFEGVTIGVNPTRTNENIFTQLDAAIKEIPWASYHNVKTGQGSVPNIAQVMDFQGRKAFVTTLKSSASDSSRVQSEIVVRQSQSPNKLHSIVDVWIHPDYANLTQLSKIVWVDISECWFASPKERYSIYLDKNSNGQLCFKWRSDIDDGRWTKRHPDQLSNKAVPLGQWISLETIWEKDTNRNILKVNGDVYLDFIGVSETGVPANSIKGPASYYQPIKHYVGKSIFDWMNSRGYEMTIAYSNWKIVK